MIAYNFSKLRSREKRVYSISDVTISSAGIPVKFLIILLCVTVGLLLFNGIICWITGFWYIVPLDKSGISSAAIFIDIGIPIVVSYTLYSVKVSGYRLVDIILLYLRPRAEISISGEKIVHSRVTFDAFLER